MEAGLAMYSRALDVSRKSARRARIRRQWTAEGQSCVFDEDFEGEEKAALKKLKEVEFWASWADISDDEREEEAESASRRKATTASEEHEEDDESSVGEVDDDQDVDDDQSVSDDQDVEDDKDLEEERGEDADNDQEN